jgi:hypothetical protein
MRLTRPLIFGLCGALLVWGASQLLPDRYTSTAILRVSVEPFPAADVINHAWQETVSRQVLKRLIERLNLYPEERERLPMEDVIENAKKDDITLDVNLDHDVLLTFAYRDPTVAKAVAAALIGEMVAASEDRARTSPGWGRLEVKQPVAAAERGSTGLAFWRPSRYSAKGTLLVRKQDAFKFDPKAAEQRVQDIKIKAFTQLRYSVESYGSVEDLNRHLRIDTRVNVLIIKLTESDARRAQLIASRLVTGVVDANQRMPDCAPDSNSVNAIPQHLSPRVISPDIDIVREFPTGTPAGNQPDLDGLPHVPALRQLLVANANCRNPDTPSWARTIDILDPPSLPESPDGPSRPILSAFGFFLGLGLWIALRGR